MRDKIISISLIALFLVAANQFVSAKNIIDVPVEVIEVRDLGVSTSDPSKSIIEVHWRTNPAFIAKVVSFNLILSITYADGAAINVKKQAEGKTLSTRFEVPSVNFSKGKSAAFIKKMNAIVTAVIPEKQF